MSRETETQQLMGAIRDVHDKGYYDKDVEAILFDAVKALKHKDLPSYVAYQLVNS